MSDSENFSIPSNNADKQKIKDAIYEISAALQFIEDKREFIKDVADMLHGKYNIPKKITMKIARTIFKDNYSDLTKEVDNFTILFESLFSKIDNTSDEEVN